MNGYYSDPTTVTLSANDFAGGSGVASIEYLLDCGALDDLLRAVRRLGRRLAHDPVPRDRQRRERRGREDEVVHDRRAGPVISITTPSRASTSRSDSSVTPVYSCIDTASGVVVVLGPGDGDDRPDRLASYTVTAADNAGNTSSADAHLQRRLAVHVGLAAVERARPASVDVKFRLGGELRPRRPERHADVAAGELLDAARRSARRRTRAARSATRAARTRTRGTPRRAGATHAASCRSHLTTERCIR